MSDHDILRITGGEALTGDVLVRGAKNSIPKNMVAALLTDEPCTISNVAAVRDIEIVSGLIQLLGGSADRDGDVVAIHAANLHVPEAAELEPFARASRIPVLVCGPLLHRLGEAVIHMPGGCAIGDRPVDMHVEALRAFGAMIEERPDEIHLTVQGRLHGAKFALPYPSVGATEQVLLTAVLAEGDTELSNAALEPEILDLIAVLQKMGAIISVQPSRVIRITGVDRLRGFKHRSMPDRLEAASWAAAALATDGRISVLGARQADMMTFLNAFRGAGGEFEVDEDRITFWRASERIEPLLIETDVHPGFMTDWQPPLVTALTQANGISTLHETVYEDRLGYTKALVALGAQIQTFRQCLGPLPCRFGSRNHVHSAVIVGPTKLHGGELTVPDLRGGFSYVVAALTANGTSDIHGASLLDRGYERFREKLTSLGAHLH